LMPETLKWEDKTLWILDQRKIPFQTEYLRCTSYEDVASAIEQMAIRGAPAIGIAAAYGVVLASHIGRNACEKAISRLAGTRPTAVNLFWALMRMKKILECTDDDRLSKHLLTEAAGIFQDDIDNNRNMALHGMSLLSHVSVIMTHCNAGALATGGYGTALGLIRKLQEIRNNLQVYACETRPLLQGGRLTSWELWQDGIDVTVICDSMAASVMLNKGIHAVIVGADRVAANGDVANKIGTYGLAVLARYHNIPFYVASPISTFDRAVESGREIPIEERAEGEIRSFRDIPLIPDHIPVHNPAFDVTPADLVSAIITEKGNITRPDRKKIRDFFDKLNEE